MHHVFFVTDVIKTQSESSDIYNRTECIMKLKHRGNRKQENKPCETLPKPKPQQQLLDSDEEEGFSKWIRSEEGLETLKLFVLGNSLIVFIAISWPQIKETLDAVYYMYLDYSQREN